MKILFIGGTGNISRDASLRVLEQGHSLYHLNRGTKQDPELSKVKTLIADINDTDAVMQQLESRNFDVVVDFIAFKAEQLKQRIQLFKEKTAQYVFISSASAYRKPAVHPYISEATPLINPFWDYSRDKIACEQLLQQAWQEHGFPVTIIRPSHTYGKGWIPTTWTSSDFTVAKRMLEGKEIVVQGDGQSLWTLTHTRDFAVGLTGLLGNPAAIGEVFQICGEEALSWDMIHQTIAGMLGVEAKLVHVPSDFIARVDPEMGQHFLGDKSYSALFDCSKVKRLVPEFRTRIPFHQGVRESIEWYLEDSSRQKVHAGIDAVIDRVLLYWHKAMDAAFS